MVKFDLKNNKIKYIILAILVLALVFFVSFKNFQKSQREHIESISSKGEINTKVVSSRELFLTVWELVKYNYVDSKLNKQNWEYWKKRYLKNIKTDDDVYVAVNSFISSLNDPYSKFLSKSEFESQNNIINAKAKGIGVNIASISGKIYIMNVLKGTPADMAGLLRGDIILEIDGFKTKGQTLFQVIQHMKGALGTSLDITVLRGDKKISKKIKREEINIKSLDYKTLENNIGYIQIASFISKDLPMEFLSTLDKLKDTKALVIDIRGNTGGLFQNAVFIANLFLENCTLVKVLDNEKNINIWSADENSLYSAPIVVLIDKNSASASEIFAGAMKDNKRAKLVGGATFGKGLVQKIYSLPNRTGINLTVAKYLTPSNEQIDKIGIKPDFEVLFTKEDLIEGKDTQLEFALSYLNSILNPLL